MNLYHLSGTNNDECVISNNFMNDEDIDSLIEDKSYLPYVERFRPQKLDDVMSHDDIVMTLKNFINKHNVPHMLFYGPPGTGKTSAIEAFTHEVYGDAHYMIMNINASEQRGIEIVRKKIKNFVSTKPIYNNNSKRPKYKFVILDEADAMTNDAQAMLKRVIEKYTKNARFCLICNCIKKINDAIQSRCTIFKFSPMDYTNVLKKIDMISHDQNIKVTPGGVDAIWKLSNGDMRKVMHMLQVISISYDRIDADIVTNFQKYPSKRDSKKMYTILKKGNFSKSLTSVNRIINSKCYSLVDVISEMTHHIIDDIINENIETKKAMYILTNLRDVEMNLIATTNTHIQLCGMISVFVIGNNV